MATTVINCENINNFCRTCMRESSTMFDIFSYTINSISLADMLMSCTTLSIFAADNLPKRMCNCCYNSLSKFFDFRECAESVDVKFKEVYANNNLNNIDLLGNGQIIDIKIENMLDVANSLEPAIEMKHEGGNETDENDISNEADPNMFFEDSYDLIKNEEVEHHSIETSNNIQMQSDSQEEEIYECKKCRKQFKRSVNFHQHQQKYPNGACAKRNKYSNKVLHINEHGNSNDNIDEEVECNICSAVFKSVNSLSAHMRKHVTKGRVLACQICGRVFTKVSHLKRHQNTHEDRLQHKCTLCPKSFQSKIYLKQHLDKHIDKQSHVCPYCQKTFTTPSSLAAHIKIHTNDKQYLCPTCGKRFDSSTNLNQHIKRHTGIKPFSCSLCPRKFVSKAAGEKCLCEKRDFVEEKHSLLNEVRTDLRCEVNQSMKKLMKWFKNKFSELKLHSQTHTGERSHKCETCGAGFTKQSSLAQHNLRHLGVKPHQCDACPMRFTSRDHLKRHYRVHTGEKPYRCDICDRAFTQSNDLVKHRRGHLGDKLYKCTECPESFRLKTELREHISQHYISSQLEQTVNHINDAPQDHSCSKVLQTALSHNLVDNMEAIS